MKKIFIIFLVFLNFTIQSTYANNKQSQNTFTINIADVPTAPPKKQNSGLSDGAIAAITLGSTFGGLGILTGIGYYFYKNSKELQAGLVCGKKCPYQTIDCKNFSTILAEKKDYTYLMKAAQKSNSNQDYYYLIIPDTEIKSKTFDTVFFEIPKLNSSSINFRIIQASKPYKTEKMLPQLDSDIFINPNDENVKKIPTYTQELNPDNGFLIKSGTITNSTNNIATLTTQNLSAKDTQIYAIIVEFWTNK